MSKQEAFAIIKVQDSQFKVQEGSIIEVNRMKRAEGEKFAVENVLLLVSNKDIKVGKPYVKDANISAEIIEHIRGKKVRLQTFKAKTRTRRTVGHRQDLTKILITGIK